MTTLDQDIAKLRTSTINNWLVRKKIPTIHLIDRLHHEKNSSLVNTLIDLDFLTDIESTTVVDLIIRRKHSFYSDRTVYTTLRRADRPLFATFLAQFLNAGYTVLIPDGDMVVRFNDAPKMLENLPLIN